MLFELSMLAIFAALGIVARLCYVGLSKLEKYIKLAPITIIFDFIATGCLVIAMAAIAFIFNDGILLPYMIIGTVSSFGIVACLI